MSEFIIGFIVCLSFAMFALVWALDRGHLTISKTPPPPDLNALFASGVVVSHLKDAEIAELERMAAL